MFPAPPDIREFGPGTFAIHWFAALYVVVDGWQELGLRDPEVDALLQQTEYVQVLRRFRNAVYHFKRAGMGDNRMQDFRDSALVQWAMTLGDAFRDFFNRANNTDRTSSAWVWVDRG